MRGMGFSEHEKTRRRPRLSCFSQKRTLSTQVIRVHRLLDRLRGGPPSVVIAGGAGLLNRLRGGQHWLSAHVSAEILLNRLRGGQRARWAPPRSARLLNRLRGGQQQTLGRVRERRLLNRLRGGQLYARICPQSRGLLNRLRGGQREILKPSTHFFKMLRQKPHCGLRSCVPFATF